MNTYDIDHRYPGSQQSSKNVVLYGEIGTPEFLAFHEKLKTLAESKKIGYTLRHYVMVLILLSLFKNIFSYFIFHYSLIFIIIIIILFLSESSG